MSDRDLTLDEAVIGAGEAPPSVRIEFRDAIARHGPAGIARVVPWLRDPKMAAFAVRVIARAAEFDAAQDARRALQAAFVEIPEPARTNAVGVLTRLGVGKLEIARGASKPAIAPEDRLSLDQLVEGHLYRRRDLHASGLGGNRQKGISYPAVGTYVLLFSDPDSVAEWGYRDTWVGSDSYRYYGEWDGPGDMQMRRGNLAIVERSPEIYLFVKVSGGHRYAGRFECFSRERVLAAHDGGESSAIVFTLTRAKRRSG
jgi:hypothetical protein